MKENSEVALVLLRFSFIVSDPFLLYHSVGNGNNTFLRHDSCHSLGPLALIGDPDCLVQVGIAAKSRDRSLFNGGQWVWPSSIIEAPNATIGLI